MSKIITLGAYGAKSTKGGSSAFLLNERHLLDAGNVLYPLGVESAAIEYIWITHSHLDHISDIAYILDNYYTQRKSTLMLCGKPETLRVLQEHFFNNKIWPDFSKIPLQDGSSMSLGYKEISLSQRYRISEKSSIYAFQTDHTVPSCGYVISTEGKSVLISADTHTLTNVVKTIKEDPTITTLVLECSFPSKMFNLAKASKHLTAKLLFEGLDELPQREFKLYINHLKPSYEIEVREEISLYKKNWNTTILHDGDCIYF
jgi:ribonuclease BN (tRNA processing enzyme)